MSGADWLAVVLLAGAVIVDVAADQLRRRRRRRLTDRADQASHRRLMAELERQP